MIIYPSMLIDAAEKAGMRVPKNPDEGFDTKKFAHFNIFCTVQLCRPVRWGEHWDNAKVVARIPNENLDKVTLQDLLNDGLEFTL